jgi:hypothetical protein
MLRHRPAWLAALGLAALVIAAPARAQESHKYLPNDAEMIATLNFTQILESELAKTHKEQVDMLKGLLDNAIQNNEQARKYLESLGFDPFRHFQRITVAAAASIDPEKGLAIIEGKFDPEKFQKTAEKAAQENGDVIKVIRLGNHKVWEINVPAQDKTLYVSLPSKSVLLASVGKDMMKDALSRSASAAEPELKKEVAELLKTTKPDQSLSFVATGNALSKLAAESKAPQAAMAIPILKTMVGVSAAITARKNIEFQVGIGTSDKKAADALSGQASTLILFGQGMVAQRAKDDPKLAPALEVMKTLRTTVEGTTVLIRGEVSAAVLDKALKNAGH